MKKAIITFLSICLFVVLCGCNNLDNQVKVSDVKGELTGGISFTLTNVTNKTIEDIIVVVEHHSTEKGIYTEKIEISSLHPNTPKTFSTREHESSIISEIKEIRKK